MGMRLEDPNILYRSCEFFVNFFCFEMSGTNGEEMKINQRIDTELYVFNNLRFNSRLVIVKYNII